MANGSGTLGGEPVRLFGPAHGPGLRAPGLDRDEGQEQPHHDRNHSHAASSRGSSAGEAAVTGAANFAA